MSIRLRQIPINCPHCGEYLFEVQRNVYVAGKGTSERTKEDYACKCQGQRWIDLIRSAVAIHVMRGDARKELEEPPEKG